MPHTTHRSQVQAFGVRAREGRKLSNHSSLRCQGSASREQRHSDRQESLFRGSEHSAQRWQEDRGREAVETDYPRGEVVGAALAHVVQNKVEAAYRRTDLFERRRRLMNDWATHLTGER